jgi:hypothetical protein
MKNKTNVWISVLTVSAIMLLCLLLWPATEQKAEAAMLNAQPGYVLVTSGNPGGDESLFVLERSSGKILMYHLNGNRLELVAGKDLSK